MKLISDPNMESNLKMDSEQTRSQMDCGLPRSALRLPGIFAVARGKLLSNVCGNLRGSIPRSKRFGLPKSAAHMWQMSAF
jgi:hypothetical protein